MENEQTQSGGQTSRTGSAPPSSSTSHPPSASHPIQECMSFLHDFISIFPRCLFPYICPTTITYAPLPAVNHSFSCSCCCCTPALVSNYCRPGSSVLYHHHRCHRSSCPCRPTKPRLRIRQAGQKTLGFRKVTPASSQSAGTHSSSVRPTVQLSAADDDDSTAAASPGIHPALSIRPPPARCISASTQDESWLPCQRVSVWTPSGDTVALPFHSEPA